MSKLQGRDRTILNQVVAVSSVSTIERLSLSIESLSRAITQIRARRCHQSSGTPAGSARCVDLPACSGSHAEGLRLLVAPADGFGLDVAVGAAAVAAVQGQLAWPRPQSRTYRLERLGWSEKVRPPL